MKVMILALAAAGALMLAGCGGGGKAASMTPTPAPTRTVLAGLPDDHSLESGTIPVGQSQTIYNRGGVRVVATCTGEDCVIKVSDNGVATVTGGRVTISVTGPTATPGTSTPIPVVGDLPTDLPTVSPPEGAVLLPSEGERGDMVLWEDPGGSRLVWLDRRDGWRWDTGPNADLLGYEFVSEPLSFTGTYEGKAFLRHYGDAFLYPGTASLYFDGGDIDITIDIPGVFNHTWESLGLNSADPSLVPDGELKPWSYGGMSPPERTQDGELRYGYQFGNLGNPAKTVYGNATVWGYTSGSTAGGYFSTNTGPTGEGLPWYSDNGHGAWAVSYSDSSRTPAPELSHCSTSGGGRIHHYCLSR